MGSLCVALFIGRYVGGSQRVGVGNFWISIEQFMMEVITFQCCAFDVIGGVLIAPFLLPISGCDHATTSSEKFKNLRACDLPRVRRGHAFGQSYVSVWNPALKKLSGENFFSSVPYTCTFVGTQNFRSCSPSPPSTLFVS